MSIKKLLQLGSATILSLSSMLAINMSTVFASPNNCLWTGATSANFNTAGNWSGCGGTTPQATDNLIFDNSTIPGTGASLTDDITSVTFGNMSFQGNGSTGYSITDTLGSLSLSGDITDTTSDPAGGATIDAPIILSGATPTISVANSLDLVDASKPLVIGSNNVTFSGGGIIESDFPIIGNGTLNFSMTSPGIFIQDSSSPSFTGHINVTSSTLDLSSNTSPYPDMFGAANHITVSSGATLFFDGPAAASGTINEPITAGGNGAADCSGFFNDVSIANCGAIEAGLASGGNLTLAGSIVLTANSQFNSNDTITISGPLSGAFTVQNAAGNLVIASSNNTSGTANGSYGPGGKLQVVSAPAAAPKAPNTGLAVLASHPLVTLLVTLSTVFTLVMTARRLSPARR